MPDESFPRQHARTLRFTAGAPRSFTLSPDGSRAVFVRSRSGTDTVGRLWEVDVASGAERLLADPAVLHEGPEQLSAEERARRERMREGSSGIVGYSTDRAVTTAAFALSGGLYAVDLDGAGVVRALDVPGPVIDPRVSPDGRHVAYVSGRSLRVVGTDGTGDRPLADAAHADATAGLADFVAAEELDRQRGHWWSPSSDAVLLEHVDESPVQEWWIADPVDPAAAPYRHRYPAAGTANAAVRLELARLDGTRAAVAWDHDACPYLVDVSWSEHGDPLVVVMSRDQREQRVLTVDPATGAVRELARITDDHWVDAWPGATRWSPDGRLLTCRADTATDTYRLHLGDDWLSPAGLQVRGVLETDDDGVLVTLAPEPTVASVALVGWDGAVTVLDDTGWSLARRAGGTLLLVRRSMASTAASYELHRAGAVTTVTSHAETPAVTPQVTVIEAGERRVRTAVLFPTGHELGSRRLPVLLCPYGGPHHQEVVSSLLGYGEDQWFADQGFVVVVADGRGTPGRGPAWDRGVHGDLATPVLEDQVDALAAVAAAWPDDVDTARVGIRGWSFGGYLAALAVLRRPDVFHAAVAGAPVTEWRLYDTAYTERYLGHPGADPAPYDACSLLPSAPGLSRPLMVIHGLTDDNVVVAHSLRLSGTLTAAGRPHQVLPLSGVTHMTPQEDVAENRLRLELEFLRPALGA
ncbi:MAG: prolyl oligopeptidase family serine peptidase [Frankiales bacterium]|nr:prolyl oligopeptidase family serine peptidase [Frankiales bacterium]